MELALQRDDHKGRKYVTEKLIENRLRKRHKPSSTATHAVIDVKPAGSTTTFTTMTIMYMNLYQSSRKNNVYRCSHINSIRRSESHSWTSTELSNKNGNSTVFNESKAMWKLPSIFVDRFNDFLNCRMMKNAKSFRVFIISKFSSK